MLRKFTGRHKGFLPIVALVAAAAALPRRAFSQNPVPREGSALTNEWAVEQQVSERWMHERQQSRFTPRRESDQWVVVDSIRPSGAGRRIWLALTRNARPETAVIDVGANGRVARLEFHRAASSPGEVRSPSDSSFEDFLRREPGEVSLHETRAWDLVTAVPPGVPRVGLSWRDTIARVATDGPYRQELHGTRVSRILGQRTVNGRLLWLIRDSAVVRHDEQYPAHERTMAGATVSRTASGTIVGSHFWDPELPIVRGMDDTTRLAGVAILRYPDGRSFRTPARFERTRHWTLLDPSAYQARLAELRSATTRGVGGMVLVPDSRLEKRLAAGDVKARDSLLAAWQRTTDPNVAAASIRLLQMWARGAESRALVERTRIAAGDTGYLYQRLADRAYAEHPFDSTDVRAMLPFMKDPRLPWSFALSRDILYENLAQALTLWPPVVAAGTGDSACTPAACRMLAAQWTSATEPRLRDVGLVARFVTDPRRWTDTVLARAGPDHPLLRGAANLARGVGATWDASPHAPIPPAESDWRAWLQWMDGKDPRWLAWLRQSSLSPRIKQDTLPRIRFEPSHATAIRFTEARTGRDIGAELRRGYDAASSDSARLVFGTMLQGLGMLKIDEAEVADAFRSGDPTRITLARKALTAGFARSATTADSSVTIPLLQRLLAAIVDSAALWPNGVGDLGTNHRDLAILHRPRSVFFVDTLGMPARLRAEWGSRVTFLPKAAWNDRDVRAPGVFYTIAPITTWGRFARVQTTAHERFARKPDESPRAYGSGMTYWLMNVDGEWVVVALMGWVT